MTTSHHEKLARLLEELHQELAASPEIDQSLRAALQTVVDDIRRLQAGAASGTASEGGVTGQGGASGLVGEAVQEARGEARLASESDAEETPHPHHTLVERLREAADEFEGKHPNLVTLIGSVIDALQGMGI